MRRPWLQVLFWLIFYLMWSRVMYFYIDNYLNRLYFSALDVSLVVLVFYSVYLYIMPQYLRHKNLGLLLVSSGLLLLGLSGAYSGLMLLFLRRQLVTIHFDFSWTYQDLRDNRFFIALLGLLGGCFVKLASDRIALNKRMEQMKKERTIAELTYLKAQVNPHFLFNALNSLYAQMELNSSQAKGTLTAFADLLRYQLYECNADAIPLTQEIAYLTNYFTLQRMRLDNCQCNLIIDEPPGRLFIAPLLLIPFVENAFKHVSDFEHTQNYITVQIRFDKERLILTCTNTKENPSLAERSASHQGIGLVNVRKRLELVYGPDHFLQIEDTMSTMYTVHVEIRLKNAELSNY